MRAISICQPYAHLIVTPAEELPPGYAPKRVENRSWAPRDGELLPGDKLLIHAGKGRGWLTGSEPPELVERMEFGALLGCARFLGCIPIEVIADTTRHLQLQQFLAPAELVDVGWLRGHVHTSGPFCWVLDRVWRFKTPIAYTGRQGIFNVPASVIERGVDQGEWIAAPHEESSV